MLGRRIKSAVIIDPNKYAAQHLSQALHAEGLESVKHFTTAGEGLECLGLLPAGVVFVEVEMAPIDGFEFTRRVRRGRTMRTPRAPIFLMAQGASQGQVARATDAGANALLTKPLAPPVAIAAVRRVLENPRPYIDEVGYAGPCRRLGLAQAPTPCPQRRAEDIAKLRAERLVVRDGLVAQLTELGPSACAGDKAAIAQVQAHAQALADVSLLLGDDVLHWVGGAMLAVMAEAGAGGVRGHGAVLFQMLPLLAETDADAGKRAQMIGVIRSALGAGIAAPTR